MEKNKRVFLSDCFDLFLDLGRASCVLLLAHPWLGCTKMYESQNFMMADSQNWLFYPTKPMQKELGFLLQNFGKSARFQVPKNGTSSAPI